VAQLAGASTRASRSRATAGRARGRAAVPPEQVRPAAGGADDPDEGRRGLQRTDHDQPRGGRAGAACRAGRPSRRARATCGVSRAALNSKPMLPIRCASEGPIVASWLVARASSVPMTSAARGCRTNARSRRAAAPRPAVASRAGEDLPGGVPAGGPRVEDEDLRQAADRDDRDRGAPGLPGDVLAAAGRGEGPRDEHAGRDAAAQQRQVGREGRPAAGEQHLGEAHRQGPNANARKPDPDPGDRGLTENDRGLTRTRSCVSSAGRWRTGAGPGRRRRSRRGGRRRGPRAAAARDARAGPARRAGRHRHLDAVCGAVGGGHVRSANPYASGSRRTAASRPRAGLRRVPASGTSTQALGVVTNPRRG